MKPPTWFMFWLGLMLGWVATCLAVDALDRRPGCAKPVVHVILTDSTYYELACTNDVQPIVTVKAP